MSGFFRLLWECGSRRGFIKPKPLAFSVHSNIKKATGRKQTEPTNERWRLQWMCGRSNLRFNAVCRARQHVPEMLCAALFSASAFRSTRWGDGEGNLLQTLQYCKHSHHIKLLQLYNLSHYIVSGENAVMDCYITNLVHKLCQFLISNWRQLV